MSSGSSSNSSEGKVKNFLDLDLDIQEDDSKLKTVAKVFGRLAFGGAKEGRKAAGEAIWYGLTSKHDKDSTIGMIVHKSHGIIFGDIDTQSGGSKDSEAWKRSSEYLENLHPHGRYWKSYSSGVRTYSSDAVDILCEIDLDEETFEQIEKDLPRTFPSLAYFEDPDVVNSMRRVLTATANQLPDVGYVQGMNIIVGYITLHVKTETEAFELLMEMMLHPKYNLRSLFLEGLPGLIEFCQALEKIVKETDSELYSHMESIGLGSFIFAYQWILTLFTYSMPFDEIAKIWDLFFEHGWPALFNAYVILILTNRNSILQSDFEKAFEIVRDAPANPPTDFAAQVASYRLSREHLGLINGIVRNAEEPVNESPILDLD
mmetsp:Transcript_17044/g.19392  ORF Transcript_17044/g.19392 Transcript_17044/m.19392 type:complete len:374 (+) Transcript_17044:231-1352(+)